MTRSITALGKCTTVALVLGIASCGGSGSDSPTDPGGDPPTPPGGSNPVATTSVQVQDNIFDPSAIVVSPGAMVTWTWSSNDLHNVTWATGSLPNSSTQTSGTHEVTMPTAGGEYVYYCTLHGSATSGMRGTVRVQ